MRECLRRMETKKKRCYTRDQKATGDNFGIYKEVRRLRILGTHRTLRMLEVSKENSE